MSGVATMPGPVIARSVRAEPCGPPEFDNRTVADQGWEVVPTDDPFRPFRVRALRSTRKDSAVLRDDAHAWRAVLDGAGRGDPRHAAAILFLAHGAPAELQAMRDHRESCREGGPPDRAKANQGRLDSFAFGLVATLVGAFALVVLCTFVGLCLACFARGGRTDLPYVALSGIGATVLAVLGLGSHLANRRWGIFD